MEQVFKINQLNVAHGHNTLLNIDQLNMPAHKITAIIGANGAGKSTLIHALLGKVQGCSVQGRIQCFEQDVAQLISQGKIAWVGQHERFEVPLTTLDYVLLGTLPNLPWYQKPSMALTQKAQSFLCDFGLDHLSHMRIQTLSGGEKQRLAVSRALMQETDVLLFDEPTNHLDIKHQRHLFTYLRTLVDTDKSKSIVMVLHNLTDAYKHADHVIALNKGELLAQGTPDEVMNEHNLETMYETHINIYDTVDGKVFF